MITTVAFRPFLGHSALRTKSRHLQRRNYRAAYPLLRVGRALLDTAPEPKEGWFVPEDLARYGSLDAVVAFIERRLGG
jgi:hypothetical protein